MPNQATIKKWQTFINNCKAANTFYSKIKFVVTVFVSEKQELITLMTLMYILIYVLVYLA